MVERPKIILAEFQAITARTLGWFSGNSERRMLEIQVIATCMMGNKLAMQLIQVFKLIVAFHLHMGSQEMEVGVLQHLSKKRSGSVAAHGDLVAWKGPDEGGYEANRMEFEEGGEGGASVCWLPSLLFFSL